MSGADPEPEGASGPGPAIEVMPVGEVRSALHDLAAAPRQADEGAPPARVVVRPQHRAALDGLRPGDRVVVVTWLHAADRSTLRTRPRDDPDADEVGVFATRSPHRPNPIGLHEVTVVEVHADGIEVDALEALDGTPVLDLKCGLGPLAER